MSGDFFYIMIWGDCNIELFQGFYLGGGYTIVNVGYYVA